MWRTRNGFTLLSPIIALCGAAAAQPSVTPDEQRIADLVVASRTLVQEGVLDSFGHVTVRSLNNPNRYFMPRAMPPALVTTKDIVELDLNSVPIDSNAPRTNGERFIHGEIYRVRPDVQAVVHSHSPAVIPFSISPDRPLRPVLHIAGFLPARVSVYDHRDVSKDDPSLSGKLMVNNAKLGAALAKTLGNASVVLIRGHGNAVAGASLPWAVAAPPRTVAPRAAFATTKDPLMIAAIRIASEDIART